MGRYVLSPADHLCSWQYCTTILLGPERQASTERQACSCAFKTRDGAGSHRNTCSSCCYPCSSSFHSALLCFPVTQCAFPCLLLCCLLQVCVFNPGLFPFSLGVWLCLCNPEPCFDIKFFSLPSTRWLNFMKSR